MRVADEAEEPRQVDILQVGAVCDSKLFELESGRLGFMVNLAITKQTSRTIETVEIELRSTLIDASFQLANAADVQAAEAKRDDAEYRAYQFPGRCGLSFLATRS